MRRKAIIFGIAASLILGTALGLSWLKAHQKLGSPGLRMTLPAQVLDFESMPVAVSDIERTNLPPDTSFTRRQYSRSRNGITNHLQLGIVLMGTDRTSIHNPQFCLTGQGWSIERTELDFISVRHPHPYELPVMRITARGIQRYSQNGQLKEAEVKALFVYWFVADQQVTADRRERMWLMAKELLRTGVLQRWAYVHCIGLCYPGQEGWLYQEIKDLISASVPEFQIATVPATGGSNAAPLSAMKAEP